MSRRRTSGPLGVKALLYLDQRRDQWVTIPDLARAVYGEYTRYTHQNVTGLVFLLRRHHPGLEIESWNPRNIKADRSSRVGRYRLRTLPRSARPSNGTDSEPGSARTISPDWLG